MSPDPFDLLTERLKALQSDTMRWSKGEPFPGFSQYLQTFQRQLQGLKEQTAKIDELERARQARREQAAEAAAAAVEAAQPGDECRFPEGSAEFQRVFQDKFPPDIRTPANAIPAILDLAGIAAHDVVYDLGCGDARVLIAAAQRRGARGVGIEGNPALVVEAQANVRNAKVEHLVRIVEGDLFKADVSEASVVYLFLGKRYNLKLREKLRNTVQPGSRVISHFFDMGDWRASKTAIVPDEHGHEHRLYAWIVRPLSERPASLIDDWNDWSDLDEWQEWNR